MENNSTSAPIPIGEPKKDNNEDWKGDTGIKKPNPLWEWNTVEMNIPREFIRKLRENYKGILGEIDHMNEDCALKKFDEALIKTLLED